MSTTKFSTDTVKVVDYIKFYGITGHIIVEFIPTDKEYLELILECSQLSKIFSKPVYFALKNKRNEICELWLYDGEPFSYGEYLTQILGQDFSFTKTFSSTDYVSRKNKVFVDRKNHKYINSMIFDNTLHFPLTWKQRKDNFTHLKNPQEIMPLDRFIDHVYQSDQSYFDKTDGFNKIYERDTTVSSSLDINNKIYTEYKYTPHRTYTWVNYTWVNWKAPANAETSRLDGPAIIKLFDIHQTTVNKEQSPLNFDRYESQWIFNNHVVPTIEVLNFCRHRNITLRDVPSSLTQSSFLRKEDEMVFLTDFVARYTNA